MSRVSEMDQAVEDHKETGKHVCRVMHPEHGDYRITWDPSRPAEVKQARESFKKLKKEGLTAYKVDPDDGTKAEVMHDFDPNAKAMIMAPALVGG